MTALSFGSALALDVDPVLVGIVVVMLAFVFFVFLFLRKTFTGFKEGMEEGKGRR